MARGIVESDWKVFRELHSVALERFARRILDEVLSNVGDQTKSAHERYLKVYDTIHRRNKEMANAFDDFRRSTMFLQLGIMYSYGLVTDMELTRFSPETQEGIKAIYPKRGGI